MPNESSVLEALHGALGSTGSGPSPADSVEGQEPVAAAAPVEGTSETEPEEATPEAVRINWDDPANPYIERFKGLQASLQQQVETRKSLEQRLAQIEEAQLAQQYAHLPPQQRDQVVAWHRQQQEQQRQIEAMEQERAVWERLARQVTVSDIAGKYGVSPQEINLEVFTTPEQIEMYAQRIIAERQRAQASAKQQAVPKFEGIAHTPPPPKTLSTDPKEASRNAADAIARYFAGR